MTLAIYRRVTAMKWIENGRIFIKRSDFRRIRTFSVGFRVIRPFISLLEAISNHFSILKILKYHLAKFLLVQSFGFGI